MDKTPVATTEVPKQPEIPKVLETPEKEEFFGYAEGQMLYQSQVQRDW